MRTTGKCRLELVPARQIRRVPGLSLGATKAGIGKAMDISRERGYYRPVLLSESQGRMSLIAGAATYEACLEDKAADVPAVIVQTGGGADDLLFALQSAGLDEPPNAVAIGAVIVQLVDSHGVARKHIAETLRKSPAWINKMENLGRKLSAAVQEMVADGQVPARTAQEIARLPGDVQATFAISAANEFLSKESVAYLVSRYMDEDTSAEERDRIVRAPKLALPNESKARARRARDNSASARLSRAIARCLDESSYLAGLVGKIDIGEVSVRMADIDALAAGLSALQLKLQAVFYPGKNKMGGGGDD